MSQKLKVKVKARHLDRTQKSKMILTSGLVRRLDDQNYEVRSQTNKDIVYQVWYDGINSFCNCIDHMNHPNDQCKHILAAKEFRFIELQKLVGDILGVDKKK